MKITKSYIVYGIIAMIAIASGIFVNVYDQRMVRSCISSLKKSDPNVSSETIDAQCIEPKRKESK